MEIFSLVTQAREKSLGSNSTVRHLTLCVPHTSMAGHRVVDRVRALATPLLTPVSKEDRQTHRSWHPQPLQHPVEALVLLPETNKEQDMIYKTNRDISTACS